MTSPKLSRPLTIAEIAEMAGWSRKRTRNYLRKLNEEVHGMLLIRSGGETNRRFLVHPSALRAAAPALFEPCRNLETDVEDHDERIATLEQRLQQAAQAIGAANREIAELRLRCRAA